MFSKTMSESPLNEATELTINSGADVPKATIVNPITKSEILFYFANHEAPSTTQLDPKNKLVKPTNIKMEDIIIFFYTFLNVSR
jgi:hypothetical protein